MILIAFENIVFPLAKQCPSENIGDWKKGEMDTAHIIPEESDKSLPSVKHRKRKTEKEKVLKKVVKSKYDTSNNLDELLYKAREYLDSDLIKKYFNYNTLEKIIENLFDTIGSH